jgi:hypothetical protein
VIFFLRKFTKSRAGALRGNAQERCAENFLPPKGDENGYSKVI